MSKEADLTAHHTDYRSGQDSILGDGINDLHCWSSLMRKDLEGGDHLGMPRSIGSAERGYSRELYITVVSLCPLA